MTKLLLTFLFALVSANSYAIDIQGEAYKFSGKINTITLSESGGTINAVGQTGQYGKIP